MSYSKKEALQIENKKRIVTLGDVVRNLFVRVEQPLEYIHATTTHYQKEELDKVFRMIEQIDMILCNNEFEQTELTEAQKIMYGLTD